MAARLAGTQWPIGRRTRARTKVKWEADNRPVRWIAAAGNKPALWIVVRVTGARRLVAEGTVSVTEAFPAAAHLVAPTRLAAAPAGSAEAALDQAVRGAVPAWAVGEVVAADGGGK